MTSLFLSVGVFLILSAIVRCRVMKLDRRFGLSGYTVVFIVCSLFMPAMNNVATFAVSSVFGYLLLHAILEDNRRLFALVTKASLVSLIALALYYLVFDDIVSNTLLVGNLTLYVIALLWFVLAGKESLICFHKMLREFLLKPKTLEN